MRLPAMAEQESAEADLTEGFLKISMTRSTDKAADKVKVKINKK